MACSGAHCSFHDTGTATCSGHRAACATNRPLSVSGDFGVDGGRLRASDINNLRVNLRNELARWNLHSLYNFTLTEPTAYVAGSSEALEQDVDALHKMAADVINLGVNRPSGQKVYPNTLGPDYALLHPAGTPNIDKQANDPIDNEDWALSVNAIRTLYDDLRNDCICNADCSCNAVCACHNDCGCNYSDERLKTDIEYL